MSINAFVGAAFGFACWLGISFIIELARKGRPQEWHGMSAEQRRLLRGHERRRAKIKLP